MALADALPAAEGPDSVRTLGLLADLPERHGHYNTYCQDNTPPPRVSAVVFELRTFRSIAETSTTKVKGVLE